MMSFWVHSVSFYQFLESFEQKTLQLTYMLFISAFKRKTQSSATFQIFFKGTKNWQLDETLCNDLIKMRQKKITYLFFFSLIW
jgi:hypothetical protein